MIVYIFLPLFSGGGENKPVLYSSEFQ